MAKNIEPKLVTIGDYLKIDKDTKFVIPEYLRENMLGRLLIVINYGQT